MTVEQMNRLMQGPIVSGSSLSGLKLDKTDRDELDLAYKRSMHYVAGRKNSRENPHYARVKRVRRNGLYLSIDAHEYYARTPARAIERG